MTKPEACHAVFDDLGTHGALLPSIMHDASCSLRFVNADLAAATQGTSKEPRVAESVRQVLPELVFMMLTAACRLRRLGVRGELSGKGEEMVGNLPIGLLFGNFAAAKTLEMAGDDGRGANGI